MAPRAIAALWSRFAHLYGLRFENCYGPALDESGRLRPIAATWAKALSGFTSDDLARGLRACLDRNDGWPPALPEFRALCLPQAEPGLLAPYHRLLPPATVRSDEQRERSRVAGRAALAQLKTKLQGNRHEAA